ncbi:hypothetical protein T07_11843 [Trichinella nelsoni]|uniref:Uncharacterized protein n=1 Tax=Trichinella nelsoni TaxID=6336 RepID=A0A0V0SJU9_9BILA|nr:hypothetical protein T07_11843 [Trichinella nelsoni]
MTATSIRMASSSVSQSNNLVPDLPLKMFSIYASVLQFEHVLDVEEHPGLICLLGLSNEEN